MDRFEELKQRYASVLAVIGQQGVQLSHLHVQDNKLFIQGAAPSENAKNVVWTQIKAVNPIYDDITVDLTVDSSLPQPKPPARTYTVQLGDSLSKIARNVYGDANAYMRIFEANRDKLKDPDRIQVGQELKIPA